MNWWERYIVNYYTQMMKSGKIPDPNYLEPAKIYGEITSTEIYDMLPTEYLNPNNNSTYKIRRSCWDGKYRLTTTAEMKRFLKWDKTETLGSEPEFSDCDDYAVVMWGQVKKWTKGLAFGLMITNTPAHAKNIFIDNRKVVWEVEPQGNGLKELYNKTMSQYFF